MAISSGTKGFLVGFLVALVLVAFLQQFNGFYHSPHKVSEDQMQAAIVSLHGPAIVNNKEIIHSAPVTTKAVEPVPATATHHAAQPGHVVPVSPVVPVLPPVTTTDLANEGSQLDRLRHFGTNSFLKLKSTLAEVLENGISTEQQQPQAAPVGDTPPVEGLSSLLATSHSARIADEETAVAGAGANSTVKLTRHFCEAQGFGQRSYLPLERKMLPPMLYTFPGSGNTWGRLLIEHATGIYSGSVYNDQSLLDALPGEFTCDWRVSVVKVHPHTHTFADLYSGHFHSDNGKCKKGDVKRFQRAVLLIRNPFDSIWSEYQRRVTQSHVQGILRKTFDWSRWQANAASLSNSYHEMWAQHYKMIEAKFKPEDILYLRYEDLKNKKTRVETLGKVASFLRIPVTNAQLRLQCAFVLSESTQAHRTVDPDVDMTKEVAYTKELSCRMYNLFGKFITPHNYTSWKGWDCSGFPAIHNINVGPRGEYNRQWIAPGKDPVDFGGHEQSSFDPNAQPRKGGGRGQGRGGGGGRGGAGRGAGAGGAGRGVGGALGAGVKTNPLGKVGQVKVGGGQSQSQGKIGGGMALSEATNIAGVGNLGKNKPAWS